MKICGITHRPDAFVAAALGADAIGLNFYEGSPRYLPPSLAGNVAAAIPGGVAKVGVFVNATVDDVIRLADSAQRRVGDGGQLGTRRIGMLRGAHSGRVWIDVEGRAGQRVGVIGQAHGGGGTDLHRAGEETHAGNGRSRQEGGDPPRDCTSS